MPNNPTSIEMIPPTQSPMHAALKISCIYAIISILWILFSDSFLSFLVDDIEVLTRMQMVKGWFFVLATSLLIFFMLQKDLKKIFRIKETLRNSREQLLTLMNSLPTALAWADEKGNILFSNKKLVELFGYTIEEMPTVEQWFQLAYPDQKYRQKVVSQWQMAVENAHRSGQEIAPIEVIITCKDGATRYVAISGTLLHDKIIAIFNDLTESKEAKKALEESENRYRTLFNSANDAILIMQDDLCIDCNEKTLELFDCNREQIIGQPPYKFSPTNQPDGQQSSVIASKKIMEVMKGKPDVFEWRHKKLNGEAFDAEVSLNLIEIGHEKFTQGILRDISARNKLDQELKLMKLWVEQSVDLFFWVGGDSSVLYVNQAVCHALGYTIEELRTMKVSDFDLGLPLEKWSEFTQKVREKGSHRFESRLLKKSGQVFPVEITANTISYDEKDHFFAYGRDISARVSAEKQRKELENQLRQTQKMEAIGTLAGGIAHDFNNILSAVLGYCEIALDDELPPDAPARRSIENVLKAGMRAKDLVKQILAFSRQTEYEKKPILVSPIVKEVLKLLRASLPSNIEIRSKVFAKDSKILGDPTQIHQVLMNLCTNSGYAMRKSGGILEIELSTVDFSPADPQRPKEIEPGAHVALTVSDNGPGMPPSVLEQVFNPFYTTKPKEEGTGLGLSVVHGIVMDHKGQIRVDSQPDRGTDFKIHFPMLIDAAKTEAVSEKPSPHGHEHILVVDDEKSVVDTTRKLLEGLGYTVTGTTNSRKALEVFSANPAGFDLVITDQTMPELSGDQLARKLLALKSDVPIILCTGFSFLIDEVHAKSMGIRSFIMKPVVRRELAEAVRQVLDHY